MRAGSRVGPWILVAALASALLATGCDEGGSPNTTGDVVKGEREQSSADRLALLLSARVVAPEEEDLEPLDGFYLDSRQIRSVKLRVDDEPWGTYEVAPPSEGAGAGSAATTRGWRFAPGESLALVVAVVGEGEDDGRPMPTTAGAWVAHLQRRLLAGGHVLEVAEVTLGNSDGDAVVLRPGLYLPFTLEDGASSGVVGPASLSLSHLGGAQ